MLRRLAKNRMALAGVIIICMLVLLAVAAPWVAPHDPLSQSLRDRLALPSRAHLLGTDYYGRDVLSRIIFGTRYSLTVGLISIGIGLLVGASLGLLAGYYGGTLDRLLTALIDVLMAFPGMLLALAIVGILGPGLFNVMLAVGVWSVPIFARIVRAVALSTRETEFVLAARVVGAGGFRIMFRHILPACIPSLIVLCTLRMSTAILTAAGLSFLGLGAQPPTPEWGSMLNESRGALRQAPWVATFTGLVITLTVTAFNFVGDALRDILDPRMKQ
jgi:peptide/nickel transport system permease protein